MKMYKNLKAALSERNEVRSLKIMIAETRLPEVLFDFPNLEELFIEGALCSGLTLHQGVWTKLRVLSLKLPHFDGDSASLFSLPKLEILKLIESPLSQLRLPLGQVVAPLKSLTIKDCGLKFLPEEINLLSTLAEMNLTGNKLSAIPHGITELKLLKRLNLDSNAFTVFPDIIANNKNISHLSIDHNAFSEEEKARIQRQFHIWPN